MYMCVYSTGHNTYISIAKDARKKNHVNAVTLFIIFARAKRKAVKKKKKRNYENFY